MQAHQVLVDRRHIRHAAFSEALGDTTQNPEFKAQGTMADDDNSDDDLYGTETNTDQNKIKKDNDASSDDEPMDEGADSGDDDDDDSESDLEIIIDKPPTAAKPAA